MKTASIAAALAFIVAPILKPSTNCVPCYTSWLVSTTPCRGHCASSERCSTAHSRNKYESSTSLTLKCNLTRCHSHRVGLRDSPSRRSFRGSSATERLPVTRWYELLPNP